MQFLPTSKVDQNALESYFNSVRALDGSNSDPNGLELNWRISRLTVAKILKDENFDFRSIKENLQNHLDALALDDDGDVDLGDDFDFESEVPDALHLEEVAEL